MQKRCTPLLGAVVAALSLAGCGGSGSAAGTPSARAIPLAAGVHVATDLRRCDPGVRAYCARELTLTWSGSGAHRGVAALDAAEGAALARAGWSFDGGEAVGERSAQSPGSRLWLTYGPVADDLKALGKGNIFRAPAFVEVLRHDRAAAVPALSVLLEKGRN